MRTLLLVVLIALAGCAEQSEKEGMEEVTGQHVAELEKTACFAADSAGTCNTKLPSLGFITAEECCGRFGKCC